jgi:hypothetical protein
MSTLSKQILSNAQAINEMHKNIKTTFKKKDENEQAWADACNKFHSSYDIFAFPGGLAQGLALLKKKDLSIMPIALAYLKADPYFFRSGYIKGKIATQLKKFTFNQDQIKDLQNSIINTLFKPSCPEFKYYCRLAIKVADNEFLTRIQEIIKQSTDVLVLKRAHSLFDLLQAHCKTIE